MSENGTSDYHESILKNFKLPGKVPIEDLMSKYSGTLEITFGVMSGLIDKHLQKAANGKSNHYGDDEEEDEEEEEDENDLSALDISNGGSPRRDITNGRNKTNNNNDKNNNDGNDEFRENNRNIDDQSDCVIISSSVSVFKTPARNSKRPSRSLTVDKTTNASTSPKAKPKTTASTTTTTSTTTNTASRAGKRKREAYEEAGEAKPGTLGSRQTIPTQSRESKLNRLTVQCNDLIDTKNLVTSDMMVSLQELCQRAKIKKVPDDPTDLLMKFSIIIPRLSEMDAYIEK